MSERRRLERLAGRTRELLEDLEGARPEVLSPVDLNRSLQQVLRNQVAILEALARGGAAAPAEAPAASSGAWSRRAVESNGSRAFRRTVELSEELAEDPILELEDEPTAPASDPAASASGDAEEGDAGDARGLAERYLDESRIVPSYLARVFIEEFDNRDKDFDKGLDKMNRWAGSGGSGTPFQWRGSRAYLNLSGSGEASVKNYEEQLMTRMGFSRRLGRLDVPGLAGEVVVYERPS